MCVVKATVSSARTHKKAPPDPYAPPHFSTYQVSCPQRASANRLVERDVVSSGLSPLVNATAQAVSPALGLAASLLWSRLYDDIECSPRGRGHRGRLEGKRERGEHNAKVRTSPS